MRTTSEEHLRMRCGGEWARMRRRASHEGYGVDRRQGVADRSPAIALVLAEPKAAGGRAEGEAVAGIVDRQRVAIDDVIGVPGGRCLRSRKSHLRRGCG